MSQYLLLVIMFFAGITVALQPVINARLAQKVGLLQSACISFAVGTMALFLAVLLAGKLSFRAFPQTAWWEWSGGILGAFFVSMTIFVVPRVGVTAAMAATIAAQLTAGLMIDYFGLFGFKEAPLSVSRTIGVLLLMLGAALVFKR